MDQDTSNNPGKASWREKLGLGTSAKEMPKISNEFKAARTDLNAEPKPEFSQRAPRKPQPVARPAPMAPRPQPAPAKAQSGGPLAERLKAQRAAAEKLAEQRILAARANSAEAKAPEKAKPQSVKPKFTFAEEEIAQARREAPAEQKREREYQPAFAAKPAANGGAKAPQAAAPAANPPPLVPPRPALGGERPIAAPQPAEGRPPPGPNFPPRYPNAAQPAGYRPIDPPPGGLQVRQAAAQAPRPAAPAGYGNGSVSEARGAAPRGYDPYRRRPSQEPSGPEDHYGGARSRRSPALPAARGRKPAYEDDMGDVFEDEAPPRRRASAQDYHQAYRDYEEGYDHDERRRSRAPWIVLLALIIAGALAAAAWYYWYYVKPGQVSSAEVPVVAAPEKPAKTGPEPVQPNVSTLGSSNNQGSLEATSDRRKQIYDRVLGEESIEGNQIVPTQEQPQRVEPAGDQPQPPLQGTLPQPNNQGNSSGAGASDATDPLPLPLPPPPGGSSDQQGNLNASEPAISADASDVNSQQVAQPASANDMIAPIPGEAEQAEKAITSTPTAPPPAEQPAQPPVAKAEVKPADPAPIQAVEPAPAEPQPQVAKPEAKKKVASAEVEEIAGPQPMVLTPEGGAQTSSQQPSGVPDQVGPSEAQPEKKSGSFFNFGSSSGKKRLTGKRAEQPDFSNSNLLNTGRKPVAGQTTEPQDQVASIAPEDQAQPLPMPAPETAQPETQSAGGGYIAQLASFRSEAEALAEYDRLRTKHGDVVGGLSPRVTKANISGGTRYRLGVGPVSSRDDATRICNSLIAAGERDCLVRGN